MLTNLRQIITYVILLFAFSANAGMQDSIYGSPQISFDCREISLGEVSLSSDSIKSHEFVFTNIGYSDLVIVNVATGCGCTKATYSKGAIPAGKTGVVNVTYNASRQRKGPFRKSITIFSNDPRRYVRIFVTGTVVE